MLRCSHPRILALPLNTFALSLMSLVAVSVLEPGSVKPLFNQYWR